MELILWRHAEADNGTPDLSRKLTAKGISQAAKMANWLKPQLAKNTQILVSPATRTTQTADALGLDYSIQQTLAPDASLEQIIQFIEWPTNELPVLIVGHQPTLGNLAALVMTGKIQAWSIKKGAVWWLSNRLQNSESQTVLKFSVAPDHL